MTLTRVLDIYVAAFYEIFVEQVSHNLVETIYVKYDVASRFTYENTRYASYVMHVRDYVLQASDDHRAYLPLSHTPINSDIIRSVIISSVLVSRVRRLLLILKSFFSKISSGCTAEFSARTFNPRTADRA